MRVLVEALHVAAGIAVALLIAALCSWAYPLAQQDVWLVTGIAIGCIVLMGIGPMRRAAAIDRAERDGSSHG
jgi:ABC-type lipoprotein release transport system permease subunit